MKQGVMGASTPSLGIIWGVFLTVIHTACGVGEQRYGYFSNAANSSVLLQQTVWNVGGHGQQTEFSFRTCNNGELLIQTGTTHGDWLQLLIKDGKLEFHWKIGQNQSMVKIGSNLYNNEWYTFNSNHYLGNLFFNITQGGNILFSERISNTTYRTYFSSVDLAGSSGLYVGRGFTGCIMEGPNVLFVNNNNLQTSNVQWSATQCPQSDNSCTTTDGDINDCYSHPCQRGTCVDGVNSYTCTCPHLYNGTNCENDLSIYGCDVQPCLHSGTCTTGSFGSRNYQCTCTSGFTGTNCESDINECGPNPCHHDVPCIDKIGTFECNCTGSGYQGVTCADDIDECTAWPGICSPNGQCFNNPGSYTCVCPDGMAGPGCQDIDECVSSPCEHGGTCQNQDNMFTCLCAAGYTGTMCGVDINDCVGVTCPGQNSECKDLVNSYECVCMSGFTGLPPNCEVDECSPGYCQNGATCIDLANAYRCICPDGYTDANCTTDIDDCFNVTCQNGATCRDGLNTFTCDCVAGYNGDLCDNNINDCLPQPCQNGGTCHDNVNGFDCDCAVGYTGDRCYNDIDECLSNPCGIHITACTHGVGYYNCTCKPGYKGTNCTLEINECLPNPCNNGGTCTDLVNDYSCTCTTEWMGRNCTVRYNACHPDLHSCKNGAACYSVPPSHDFTCSCLPGYTGSQCDTDIIDCTPNKCTLPEVCHEGVNSFTCDCPEGYEGADCGTEIDECRSSPCKNGATCTDSVANYTCTCIQSVQTIPDGNYNLTYLTGYEGRNCEHDVNECDPAKPTICLNEGSCINEDGTFQCQCGKWGDIGFYTGTHCEVKTSYCYITQEVQDDPPACKNGGNCTGLMSSYECDCAPGFEGRRCKINIDECESNPCQYNGTCIDGINGYTCDCIPGITGDNCEIDIDECASDPCQHGGRCTEYINRYECDCFDTGFKGDRCEINIDDCESAPCIHDSTCVDGIKDYNCTCHQGYTSKNCDVDINECAPNPCYFNSLCHQKSDQSCYNNGCPGFENLTFSYADAFGYICECVPGSTGVQCEIDIDDCISDLCQNGTCQDKLNNYTCDCFPGYTGRYCEIDINECEVYDQPCNNGTCNDIIADFSCDCFPGFENDTCNVEIDECERFDPCKLGSSCNDKIADYDCNCPPLFQGKPYSGKNCTFELTSCLVNECHSGSTCQPFLIDESQRIQDYRCLCGIGFAGKYCNISTTMSFNGSYIKQTLNTSGDVSFRFRTTLQNAILFIWKSSNHISDLFLTVELKDGLVYLSYHDLSGGSSLATSFIPNKLLNDGTWQKVTVTVVAQSITVTVLGTECLTSSSDCVIDKNYNIRIQPDSVCYFGGLQSLFPETVSHSHYVGCMQDITVDGSRLVFDVTSADFSNIIQGCPRTEQCYHTRCNMKGDCVDLWNTFRCDCFRPNLGITCDTGYTAATFAYGDSGGSYATFNLSTSIKDNLTREFDLSFFIRSRKPDGLVLFFGTLGTTFVSLELEGGHLMTRLKFCGLEKTVSTDSDFLANGEQHFVRLYRNNMSFKFHVDETEKSQMLPTNCDFQIREMNFGTKLPNSRRRRGTNGVVTVSDFNTVTDYKGTIQDVQLSGQSLQFYPLTDPSLSDLPLVTMTTNASLTEDEVTDPVCDLLSPCENNSTCSDVFFNDFRCECLYGYRGKNCSELDFCATHTCPDGSTCQSLQDGFECVATVTFDGVQSTASYSHTLSSNSQVTTFTFQFRTLAMNGEIFWLGSNDLYYKVRILGSKVVVMYKLNGGSEMQVSASYDVDNADWYTAKVVEDTDLVTLILYDLDEVQVFANTSSVRPSGGQSLTSLLKSQTSNIVLGRTGAADTRNPSYQGCIGEFRIGKILLPFFLDGLFVNNTSKERFLLQSGQLDLGCKAGPGCQYSQCKHASSCVDDYYTYVCNCSTGYTGRWCEDRVDYCVEDGCVNGQCVNTLETSDCTTMCPAGYTGTRCETDVNECTLDGLCQNNGSCNNVNGTYTCTCAAGYTGQNCEISLEQNCSNTPCIHGTCQDITITRPDTQVDVSSFNCSCNPGYTGYNCSTAIDYCVNYPCNNGATCISNTNIQSYTCSCPSGYTGATCDINIDDCPANACQNGGTCVDGLNTYTCNCTSSIYYTGPTCEDDLDECTMLQPCQNGGLCQNRVGSPGYRCDCAGTGYEGEFCQTDIDECKPSLDTCKNDANCTNSPGDYMCDCNLGYEGKTCNVANCSAVDCINGATCITRLQGTQWKCECLQFYEGQFCEIKGPCADEPCEADNTLTCEQNIPANNYTCDCRTGWEGNTCQTDIDECDIGTVVCQNGGTCVNTPGSARCDCVLGFTDNVCQTDIDECASNPCLNDGICIDKQGEFECNCTETGYTNLTCEEDVNECLVVPCLHDGTCTNTVGSYTCACPDTYKGQDCEVKFEKSTMDDDITWYIVGPCVAVVLILIIIGVVWFMICVRNKRATRGAYSPSRQEVTGSRVELGNVMKKPPLERLI